MGQLITPDTLDQYLPGELTFDSAGLDWDGVRLCGWRYDGLDAEVPGLSDYLIVVCQEGATTMHRRCAGNWLDERVAPGSVTLMSRAAPSHWRWSGELAVAQLYLSPSAVKDVAAQVYERAVQDIELRDILTADDPILFDIAKLLMRETQQGGLGGRLYVEALKTQACLHILRHYSTVDFRKPSYAQGGLSRSQSQLLEQFIDENLDRDISLADLASVAQLSVFHFTRKFHAEFGCPPHAYVVRRRMERATRQLVRQDIPLKVIAANCGFTDQSHMNRLFRRVLGVTPAEYRRSRAS